MFSTTTKIGILGGGQLGKMLCLAAANLDLKVFVLDQSPDFPAGPYCSAFFPGDFREYEDVLAFGKQMDIVTIEIEHVNTDALRELKRLGKAVYPDPDVLDTIKDKGLQKQFFLNHGIPSARFECFDNETEAQNAVDTGHWTLPFVQKTRTAGYDGKGVAIMRTAEDLRRKWLSGPCLLEEMADMDREIAVIAARNTQGETKIFPAVEMDFHPEANLVEMLICPARISPLIEAQAEALAERVIEAFGTCGLLAVEMFLTRDGRLLVNEVAPRPHNSGHHSIETALTSQYQQHLRAICGLPLGETTQLKPAVMINLLGAEGQNGAVQYYGMETVLEIPGVFIHLYGKSVTSPFRKMGHATISAETIDDAIEKAQRVKANLVVGAVQT